MCTHLDTSRAGTASVLAVLALALAGPAAAEKFTYKYRPGQVLQNRISMAGASLTGMPGAENVKSTFRTVMKQALRVRSVSGGIVTLEVVDVPVSSSTTTAGKTTKGEESPSRSLIKMTERGRFISRKDLSAQADTDTSLDGVDALYGLNFPARDIKPGESWTDTLTIRSLGVPRKVTVTTKYAGRQKLRGRDVAKFSSSVIFSLLPDAQESELGLSSSGKVTGAVTTYFDPVQGVEIYSSGSVLMLLKADLSALSPEAGELGSALKINLVQSLVSPGTRK
jgi:hypothetical protein